MAVTLSSAAEKSRARITAAKKTLHNTPFEWYPHDSLSNIEHLRRLLGSREESTVALAREEGVMDIGCQDGELSFLFESLGCPVLAVDNEATNHNGLRGLKALRDALGSSIALAEIDLNTAFTLPEGKYGLTVFLGALYHVRNPFYVLRKLARASRYCLLSTRIARCLPDGSPIPAADPVAYLLDACELNDDDSNYWIFSELALRRLLERAGWQVCEYLSIGDNARSDPVSLQHDERAFCLLRSVYALTRIELGGGWHEREESGWRWTEKNFSFSIVRDAAMPLERLSMRLFVPGPLLERVGAPTLRIRAGAEELASEVFGTPGEHLLVRRIPSGAEPVFRCSLDRAIEPGDEDPRLLGIVVAGIDVE